MYEFRYGEKTLFFEKDESDKDKYIVFSCAKNEDDYIVEWVNHNLSIGFDKIIIADNNDDDTKLPELLSTYIANGTVQIFNCSGLKGFQLYIYNMFIGVGNYKWCAYFDCDEFLELSHHGNVKEFLKDIKEDCVLINWVVFGGCGNFLKEDGSIKDRFTTPTSPLGMLKENFYVKPIVRSGKKFSYFNHTHSPMYSMVPLYNLGGYTHVDYNSHVYYPPRYKYAYIAHYYTKSFEEWLNNKVKRGWPDEMPDILKASNYFILENDSEFPLKKFTKGLFVDNSNEKQKKADIEGIMEEQNLIFLKSSSKNVYGLILEAFFLMSNFTDHVIAFDDEIVDDALYAVFLEYAIMTGNKVACALNDEDFRRIVNNCSNNGRSYYWIDCL